MLSADISLLRNDPCGLNTEDDDSLPGFAENPAQVVEAAFRAIQHERMAGLPFLNPLLQVEAVGFRQFHGNWLGVVITPWCMNYLMLRGKNGVWQDLPETTREKWGFPAGEVNFIVAAEIGLGAYRQCALFTSMEHFDGPEMARDAALAALETLFSVAEKAAPEEVSLSKRNFLRGRFLGGDGNGTGR